MPEVTGLVYTDMNKMFLQKIEKDVGRVREICEIFIVNRVTTYAQKRGMAVSVSDVDITMTDGRVVISFVLTKANGDKAPFMFAWDRAQLETSEDPITAIIEERVKEVMSALG